MNPTHAGAAGTALRGLVALAALVVTGWTAWRCCGLRRVVVVGTSMAPQLLPGDRLLVRRPVGLRRGDIVAVPDPRDAGRTLVKRIGAVTAAGIDVRGDDADASTDSRTFGPVPADTVLGRVVYRYHPAGRIGALGQWYRSRVQS